MPTVARLLRLRLERRVDDRACAPECIERLARRRTDEFYHVRFEECRGTVVDGQHRPVFVQLQSAVDRVGRELR